MGLKTVSLSDKYHLRTGRIFLTGTQALVRLALEQIRRDSINGLNTAGYVTGYRGSPLGGMDKEFSAAKEILNEHRVKFHPAVNEDLAATALWGTQQVGLHPGARYDGVFGMWYGKGPGVDRSGDVFRHANLAGTAPNGGVLALFGDDPACKSSTVPSQSEHAIIDAQIPLFNPVNPSEMIEFGLYGYAMSRFSGCWVGMKCVTDNVDSSASFTIDPAALNIALPTDFEMPEGGLSIRWPDPPVEQEMRLYDYKINSVRAFTTINNINRLIFDSKKPRFGIVTTGKAYLDTLQALTNLGIDANEADRLGLRLLKIGLPWPLEINIVKKFAEGLEEILLVEEKRAVIEGQLKEQLYNLEAAKRPRVFGKCNEQGEQLLPSAGELTPSIIASVIAERLKPFYNSDAIKKHLRFLDDKETELSNTLTDVERVPYFCSGCPHNSSTRIPEGSRAAAGIGCHYMALWMDRSTETFTHMGGEGANWIGQSLFTKTPHIFTNLGDGTYFHSGILAIRAAVAARVSITYKILYNDAVAMTGGQSLDGPLNVATIAKQVHAEGVQRIAIVSDEPTKYPTSNNWPRNATFHGRHDMDMLQRELRNYTGVSVLIYDQTCAAEKRRRRKRGTFPNPPKRIFINELVCEGCGNCGITSNCVSIVPKETELGRKRAIDQSSCNKDFTCIDGFCPSFVSVHGSEPRKPKFEPTLFDDSSSHTALPEPTSMSSSEPYAIVIGGIGGTGVVTVSALLSMAAHIEGKGVTALDVAGLAQKNGAVYAHIRICDDPNKLHAVRIAAGGANLLLGFDMITSGTAETISKLQPGHSRAVINENKTMTAEFTRDPDLNFPTQQLKSAINAAVGVDKIDQPRSHYVNATDLTLRLLGNTIAANLFLVGYALQKGFLPISSKALQKAIQLNGIEVDFNFQALEWGRRAALDLDAVNSLFAPIKTHPIDQIETSEFLARRAEDLTEYQNAKYAKRYIDFVERARITETTAIPKSNHDFSRAISRAYYKLLAIKDEYEVARLHTDGRFESSLNEAFESGGEIKFYFAPPLFSRKDPVTGQPVKQQYGSWILPVLRGLAKLKFLRGTMLDIFGKTSERRLEQQDITEYEKLINILSPKLTADNYNTAVELAELPLYIRGFGHIKEQARQKLLSRKTQLIEQFFNNDPQNVESQKAE